jgi:hypothetical protein
VRRVRRVSRTVRTRYIRRCRSRLIRYRRIITRKGVSAKTKSIVRRKIYRVRVIRGGMKYVNRVNYRWRIYRAQATKTPTPKNKARELRWRQRT